MHLTVQVHTSWTSRPRWKFTGRREFASQGLPRFSSALYHAAQTIALEPWWIISITSNFSPCLRSNRILKLPCATTESWWICGGGTLFRCFFRLRRKTAIQTPKGCSYVHTHTSAESACAIHNSQIAIFDSPCNCHRIFFTNFPAQAPFSIQQLILSDAKYGERVRSTGH